MFDCLYDCWLLLGTEVYTKLADVIEKKASLEGYRAALPTASDVFTGDLP